MEWKCGGRYLNLDSTNKYFEDFFQTYIQIDIRSLKSKEIRLLQSVKVLKKKY